MLELNFFTKKVSDWEAKFIQTLECLNTVIDKVQIFSIRSTLNKEMYIYKSIL